MGNFVDKKSLSNSLVGSNKTMSQNTEPEEDLDITIKHYPIKKESQVVSGTLTLTVVRNFNLTFLDPNSELGYETKELDMKLKYGQKSI
jgi:hypothetical protein